MIFNEFNARTSILRDLKRKASFGVFAVAAYFAGASALLASEGGEAEPKLDPMAWNTDLAIWTAVVFIGLVVVLGVYAFGPIIKALDQREQAEVDRLASAEKAIADAKETLEQYRRKLAESDEEIARRGAEAMKVAEAQARVIVGEAKEAATRERERALKDVEAAADAALRGIAAKSAELATSLAGKILKETIDPARHARLIDGAVEELGK